MHLLGKHSKLYKPSLDVYSKLVNACYISVVVFLFSLQNEQQSVNKDYEEKIICSVDFIYIELFTPII